MTFLIAHFFCIHLFIDFYEILISGRLLVCAFGRLRVVPAVRGCLLKALGRISQHPRSAARHLGEHLHTDTGASAEPVPAQSSNARPATVSLRYYREYFRGEKLPLTS